MKSKGTRIAKKEKILKNKDEVGGICPLNFNIYTAARWGTTKRTDTKSNRMEENPELGPQKYPNWVSTGMQMKFNGGISTNSAGAISYPQTNK